MNDVSQARSASPVAARIQLSRHGERWRRFRQNPLSLLGLALTLAFLFAALFAPMIAPYSPFQLVGPRLAPPDGVHLFGTDNLGRDVLSGVLYGARTSMEVGLISTGISLFLGIGFGALAGYYGGLVDNILMRVAEFFQVLPRFFLALVIIALFGATLSGTIIVIGLLSWPEIARVIRSEFMTIRDRPFVTAAHAYGASDAHIIFREILPNAMTSVVVVAALQVPSAVLLEAGISFIGAGDPNVMSWGRMLNVAQEYMRQAWWTAAFPGLAISLMALGLALLADGVNDFFNPRSNRAG